MRSPRYLPHRPRPRTQEDLKKNSAACIPDGRWRWHWDPALLTGGGPSRSITAFSKPC